MIRTDIISAIGRDYLKTNIENDEWSYSKAYKEQNLEFHPINYGKKSNADNIDIRFVKNGVSILIETKKNFEKESTSEAQLSAYVEYEKGLTGNKIIAILANTSTDNKIKVWRGAVSSSNYLEKETKLRAIDEYLDFYTSKINDKEKVMKNTYALNNLLHKHGIPEKIRSQLVGTCLLSLKNGLDYSNVTLSSSQIRQGIKDVLDTILSGSAERAFKIGLLSKNVLENQNVRNLEPSSFREILKFIDENILPFINDKSTAGQDLLNLFFITFNKYVGKDDKNQAFTPDHITDFMAKITGVNHKSKVLDICCGSGSFLVRAMTQALEDCPTGKDEETVKKNNIFGIEKDENVFGLATTNMLIHGDGNSNIVCDSCFDRKKWIMEDVKPTIVLMNPPYNATRDKMPKKYTETWASDKKEDPSKGLYFVKFIADTLNEINQQAILAVLLPVACAIGTSGEVKKIKNELLKENTLDAVFTLPAEVFYPGAAVSVCCMVFKIGKKHSDISNPDTFFGYYKEDGFKKKKYLGRIEQIDFESGKSKWEEIENEWIDLYRNRKSVDGYSATAKVTGNSEWLCEAYMKTDYSKLKESDFQTTINNYLAYLVKEGIVYEA